MRTPKPVLVGVVGGSGSGKTWLAERLAKAFGGSVTRLSLDDFYRDRSHLPMARRANCNFDRPAAIDWPAFDQAIGRLASGKSASVPCYDFRTHCRTSGPRSVPAAPVVIVDGLWLLRNRDLRSVFQLTIFLECPAVIRLSRRLERDMDSRARTPASIRRQFHHTVEPMHRKYVEPQRRNADIILGKDKPASEIRKIVGQIKLILKSEMSRPERVR